MGLFSSYIEKLKTDFQKLLKTPKRGMALFLVMISIALMSAVVGDLSYNETIRYKVALNERDALKAEALAESGVNLARLFLVVQEKIQPYISLFASLGVPLPAYTIWELFPMDTESVKSLVSGGLAHNFGIDVDEALEKRKNKIKDEKAADEDLEKAAKEEEEKEKNKDAKEYRKPGQDFEKPDGGFGAFDGEFSVKIIDEESKISFRNWTKSEAKEKETTHRLVKSLIVPQRYDDLFAGYGSVGDLVDRSTFLANIFDYLDIDGQQVDPYSDPKTWGRTGSGSPELDSGPNAKNIKPKNAYFDSQSELNLVKGFKDSHMIAFGDALSIYGDGGKINILSAKDQVVEALVFFCAVKDNDPLLSSNSFVDETVKGWRDYKEQGIGPVSPDGFVSYLQTRKIVTDAGRCRDALDVKSSNFRIVSQATVNGITRTLTLVTRVVDNTEEKYYFLNN